MNPMDTFEESVYCLQGGHFVKKSEMSTFITGKGKKRRVCSNCKDALIDRRDAERVAKKQLKTP